MVDFTTLPDDQKARFENGIAGVLVSDFDGTMTRHDFYRPEYQPR